MAPHQASGISGFLYPLTLPYDITLCPRGRKSPGVSRSTLGRGAVQNVSGAKISGVRVRARRPWALSTPGRGLGRPGGSPLACLSLTPELGEPGNLTLAYETALSVPLPPPPPLPAHLPPAERPGFCTRRLWAPMGSQKWTGGNYPTPVVEGMQGGMLEGGLRGVPSRGLLPSK